MVIKSSVFGTFCIWVLAGWAIIHGILVCIGGPERWTGPVYDTVNLLPGSPYTWAIVLIVGGFLALFASWKGVDFNFKFRIINKTVNISYRLIKNAGLWIIGATCLCFSLGVFGAAMITPTVSLSAGDRDMVICVLSIMMTKASEPSYKKVKAHDSE